MQTGKIGVTSENLFPIIKKFLYSDHDIFLREIVSNAVDATQKLRTLASKGEYKGDMDEAKVVVTLDTDAKTITISDNGIGMTAEEVEKYINQIAFSGANDFLDKYKDDANAIIGHFGGFKGNVMIPETRSSAKIYASGTSTPIELGFEVRCDSFAIEYYDNGMVKEYKSHLTVLEDGKEILKKYIEVNDPLTYKGITFYQSSYEGYEDFIVTVRDNGSGENKIFTVPFQKQQAWEEKDIRFGVVNAEAIGQRIVRSKLWAKAGDSPAVIEWVDDDKNITIKNGDKSYNVAAKQMYATGLQVAKDPGVWFVYIGCGLMLLGLYVAFFMSHKRIWLYQQKNGDDVSVVLAGSTNKNKIEFSKQFAKLEKRIKTSYGV